MDQTPATILRHDDFEAALPHQIEPPAAWGITLCEPIPFEVTLPKWCPFDRDSIVELHWWASLCTHLHALLPIVETQQKVHYRLDKAMRSELTQIRNIYGTSVASSIAAASSLARDHCKGGVNPEEREIGCWTMAIQVAFGLLCVRTAAKGKTDPVAAEIHVIYDWISSAFLERLGDAKAHTLLVALCTGTERGTVDEKLAQWKGALAQAAEGAPDGLPAIEEALATVSHIGNDSMDSLSHSAPESGFTPGSDQTGVGESPVCGDKP